MNANRRTLLKTLGGVGTVVLAGCTGGGDGSDSGGGNETSSDGASGGGSGSDPDEWSEADISSEVEYSFPESERISYKSDPPVEVKGLNAFVQGDVLEVRGTLTAKENIPSVIEISAEFQTDGGASTRDTAPIRTGANEEHSFTISYRQSDIGSVTGFTLVIDGPDL